MGTQSGAGRVLIVGAGGEGGSELEAALKERGFDVVSAGSGAEALKLLDEDFAAVLLDASMPGMDGAQTAELAGRCERGRGTPIIFMTGECKAREFADGRGARCAYECVFKPHAPQMLSAKIAHAHVNDQCGRFFSLSLDMLGVIGFDDRPRELSASWESTLGCARKELLGMRLDDLLHPDDRAAARQRVAELRAAAGAPLTWENRILRRDGTCRRLLWRAAAFERDEVYYAAVRDVTESRDMEERVRGLNAELEKRVSARTAELEAANRELEAFAYSVSHDLRAPLRKIDGFSGILARRCGAGLDEESRRLIKVIGEGCSLMGRLIDDLLEFSRLGRKEMRSGDVDMTALARGVLEDLLKQAPGRRVDIRLLPLPSARGDAALLRQVLVNLLSNALKFTRGRPDAEVEIGAAAGGEAENVYFVKDNGAGFDMRHAGKLFGVFQRLHTSEEFEGTGIGLALASRIVKRHGGRIWAQGAPGAGATFSFALPRGGPP
ncbi:MAG: PAS domain-containing protein [Elusimicrobia bacterium]|nr:PAS domain-containing protein [Elusimicrobiota bacterium]